jgi:hypothetical protein
MTKFILSLVAASCLYACNSDKTAGIDSKATDKPDSTKPASQLLDISEADAVKKGLTSFATGNVDAMISEYDENILYTWSGGDSLHGRNAIADYWKNRWGVIERMNLINTVVQPIQVNEAQVPGQRTGKYVFSWSMVDIAYKNGKKLHFMMHTVNHYNDAGLIDYVSLYYDRLPIMEATKDLVPQ